MGETEPTYYYKQIDISGNLLAILTCDMHLESSPLQIEITEEEYDQLLKQILAEMQEEGETDA